MIAQRVQEGRFRRGRIELGRAGRILLHVEFGAASISLDRDQAQQVLRALRVLDELLGRDAERTAHALLSAFRPGLRVDDIVVLRDWLERFAEELAIEDRRDQPRSYTRAIALRG